MTEAELEQQVITIIARKKKTDASRVTLDTTFDELGIDSLDGMDLLFTFEDTFHISIPDTAAQQMKTVRQVIEGLRRALKDRGEVNELDGVRVTYTDGSWALVRASNTGPVLVLRFEAPTAERLREIQTDVEHVVDGVKRSAGVA